MGNRDVLSCVLVLPSIGEKFNQSFIRPSLSLSFIVRFLVNVKLVNRDKNFFLIIFHSLMCHYHPFFFLETSYCDRNKRRHETSVLLELRSPFRHLFAPKVRSRVRNAL